MEFYQEELIGGLMELYIHGKIIFIILIRYAIILKSWYFIRKPNSNLCLILYQFIEVFRLISIKE